MFYRTCCRSGRRHCCDKDHREKRKSSAPKPSKAHKWNLRTLGLIYGGTLLMVLVDMAFSLQNMGAYAFFHPTTQVLYNNLGLALCAAALGLLIWIITGLAQNSHAISKVKYRM